MLGGVLVSRTLPNRYVINMELQSKGIFLYNQFLQSIIIMGLKDPLRVLWGKTGPNKGART